MIPSAPNPTGDHLSAWQTGDSWANHPTAAAAAYHSGLASNSGPAATAPASSVSDPSSVGLALHRHQILDWENAMLLATHHSTTPSSAPTISARDSLYDNVASDYGKTAGISLLQADNFSSFSHPRHYEDLLSAHMTPSANSGNFASRDAWGLLNTVCSRPCGSGNLQQDGSLLQQSSAQFSGYDNFNGADSLAAAAGLYVDSVRSGGTNGYMGLNSFDQRRLDDIMKRELYTTQADFSSSRLGLNLGGRTYFSADDFAFGRWGKRSRPNSPGCLMQPAPLCQAEGCKADLSMAKHYHRRHKVCEYHSKAATVHIGNQTQRFCQQCSRFHVLDEFDDGKRSCRKRLADHNRRRRKPQPTPMTSAATSSGAVAADTAITMTAEPDQIKDGGTSAASDQARSKEPTSSQEAATGASDSSNDASGTPSEKASPTPAAEDDATKGMRAACSSASQKEAGSATGAQADLPELAHSSHTSISAARGVLALSGGGRQRTDMAMASSETSPVAAGLSLGGATDNLDGKPANEAIEESAITTREGGSLGNSLSSSKHAGLIMPWLQASGKKKQPYEHLPSTGGPAESGAGADYAPLASFKAMSSAKFNDVNVARGSWMNVKGKGADCNASDLLLNTRYGNGSKPAGAGEAGSHELLCLLSDEGELFNANKQGSSASGSSNSTLAFLDQPLDQTGFPSSDHQNHRMLPLPFSGLQNADQERQASMALSQLGPPTTMAFGGLSHMM